MTKNYTLQLTDSEGIILEKSNLVLNEGDTILMRYSKEISMVDAHNIFNSIKECLEADHNLMGIPQGIELQVLRKQ